MSKDSNSENTGLAFFSQVSASISHEIKNCLAIINENAGLLEDLVHMAEKGGSLNTERLGRIARTVGGQVRRADGIVRKMNQFAHGADHAVGVVDLYEAACFTRDLCDRRIGMAGATVEVSRPAEPVGIRTHRFYLQHLLWVCIDSLMKVGRSGAKIQIRFERSKHYAVVRLGLDPAPEKGVLESLIWDGTYAFERCLKAQPVSGLDSGVLGIRLPVK